IMLGIAEVPFADERRLVAGGLQILGDGGFAERQIVLGRRRNQPLRLGWLFGSLGPDGHTQAGWMAAGHQRSARRSADAGAGIRIGESNSGSRQAVEMRR